LPAEAVYYLVDDVRDLYQRRDELKLRSAAPPIQAAHGYRAEVRDPFGNVLRLIDHTTDHLLGGAIGSAIASPYTDRFEQLVNDFNKHRPRALSPHFVWRLVATLAK
jgi:hypothetical protein